MRDIVAAVMTISILALVEKVFGTGASMWLSLVALSFCIGVFYGAGRANHIHKAKITTIESNQHLS